MPVELPKPATSLVVPEKGRFRASMAVFYVHLWAKCDFCTKLLTKANLDTSSPTPIEQATIRFSVGQEVGSEVADVELAFLSPLLKLVDC